LAQRFTAYECNDGAQFQVALLDTEKKAYLQLDGRALQLPKKIAYTGDRYAAGGVTFWVRGNGVVTIKRSGKVSECFSITAR
jgi:membrane-bound inhibitor of C-type lysozyme